jgi:hypothetical protein
VTGRTEVEQQLAALLRESQERPLVTVTAYSEADRAHLRDEADRAQRRADRLRAQADGAGPVVGDD